MKYVRMVSLAGAGALLVMSLVSGCGPKNAGSAVRPKEVKAGEVLKGDGPGAEVSCSASEDDKTLIVDLEPTDRKVIEEMVGAKKRVPVVAYDCKSLKVLPECKLEAEFDYVGSSSREQIIEIENSDGVSASLPLASASLKASVQSGRKTAIALAEVGSRNSSLELVAKPQLAGTRASDCEGATHFVYRVDVGAFAISQDTKGEVSAAADVFGAGAGGESKDSRSSSKKEGKLDACKASSDADKKAPSDCAVPLRLYMRKIYATAEEKAKAEAKEQEEDDKSPFRVRLEPPCPPGTVRSEAGSCVKPSPAIRYQCRPGDTDECKTQCDKGHTGSCAALGRMYLYGQKVERDPNQAIAAFEKSCLRSKTAPLGCPQMVEAYNQLARASDKGGEAYKSKAEAAMKYGCDHGDALSCASWGRYYLSGNQTLGATADPERGVRYLVRACGLGDQSSCLTAASLYVMGSKKQDGSVLFNRIPNEGLDLLDRSCKQGANRSCEQLSVYLTNDLYKVKDEKRAAALFDELCKKNNKGACAEYALLQVSGGGGVKTDAAAARKTLEDLCYESYVATACYGIGLLAETGQGGVVKNDAKAVENYLKASFIKDASLRLGKYYDGGGKGVTADPAKAARYYGSACQNPAQTDPVLCKKAGDLSEKAKESPLTTARLYRRACDLASWDKPTCDKARDLMKKGNPAGPPPVAGKK